MIVRESGMLAVRTREAANPGHPVRPVGLGVELLVYLDSLKRSYFLRTWRDALCLECLPQP